METFKKQLQNLFQNNGVDVLLECNIKIVKYLDVTFNLNGGTYRNYQKPDNLIQYTHVESNDLPNIFKQIPNSEKN